MLRKQQIPNLLTFTRVLAVPASLVLILATPEPGLWLFLIFVVAALTDFFDGYLARKWNATSALGALLDPIADKLLVALMLIYLLNTLALPPVFLPITPLFLPVAIILLRELYISGLREFMAARGLSLPVSNGGKWKTATQMLAITFLLFARAYGPPIVTGGAAVELASKLGLLLLKISALLALTSAVAYTRAAMRQIRPTNK